MVNGNPGSVNRLERLACGLSDRIESFTRGENQSEMSPTKTRAIRAPSRSASPIHTQIGGRLRISPRGGGGTISGRGGSPFTVFSIRGRIRSRSWHSFRVHGQRRFQTLSDASTLLSGYETIWPLSRRRAVSPELHPRCAF